MTQTDALLLHFWLFLNRGRSPQSVVTPCLLEQFSVLSRRTTFIDLKYCHRKLLPKSWEQFFIASTGSDKVLGGHESSSWEELVKHFSPPSILEELAQLIDTTAVFPCNPIAQRGEIFLQPCYHGWRWPQSKTDCAMLRGSSRGSVSLLKLDVENRRSAQRWVGGCFLLRCCWVFEKHFHLSSRVVHVTDWSSMCCCAVITNTVAKAWFILM